MKLDKEKLAEVLPGLAQRIADVYADPPFPDLDCEDNRVVIIAALVEALGALLAYSPEPEIGLGAAMTRLQSVTSKYAERHVHPQCNCPACIVRRLLELDADATEH